MKKNPYDFTGEFNVTPWEINNGRHKWEYNDKYATCLKCGTKVKTWRVKKGCSTTGIPKCNGMLANNNIEPEDIKYDKNLIYQPDISDKYEILSHDLETEFMIIKALNLVRGI